MARRLVLEIIDCLFKMAEYKHKPHLADEEMYKMLRKVDQLHAELRIIKSREHDFRYI